MIPPSKSATIGEQACIIDEVISICNEHNKPCRVDVVRDFRNRAYTRYNEITYTTNLAESLNKDELRAILYHELGHVLLEHSLRGNAYMEQVYKEGRTLTQTEFKNFRHTFETQADLKAVQLLYLNNKPMVLDKALLRVTEGMNPDEDSVSHPSTNKRIQNMHRYYKLLKDDK